MRFGNPHRTTLVRHAVREIENHGQASIDTCLALMDAGVDPRNIAAVEHLAGGTHNSHNTETNTHG
jgi:hypothetical protein